MSPIVHIAPPWWKRWWPAIALTAGVAFAGVAASWLIVPLPTLPGHVAVPALRGLSIEEATARLKDLDLLPRLGEEVADPSVEISTVSWQSPAPETQLPRGGTVQLGLSLGGSMVVVPELTELDLAVAIRLILASGLKVGPIDTLPDNADQNSVISTKPQEGSVTRAGTLVSIAVSEGAPPIPVPSLLGLSIRDARLRLEAAGFRLGHLIEKDEGRPGTVLEQEPAPGSLRPKASTIDLTISGVQR